MSQKPKLSKLEYEVLDSLFMNREIFEKAYSIRVNGQSFGSANMEGVKIVQKQDKPGIEIHVEPNTKNGLAHIPVIISESGVKDKVYNEFYIGENAQVLIVAGCGVHNDATHLTQHDGIHTFFLAEGAKVKYLETHYGNGPGTGKKVLNPTTILHLAKGSLMEIETIQIEGVDKTERKTECYVAENAKLVIKEKIMTSGDETATTDYLINLDGENSRSDLSSRSVAKGRSKQYFYSVLNGNNDCMGHSECDAIIMDEATVKASPDVTANHADAKLIHEAAIGKIAKEQIVKLMTLGLSREEAEQKIIDGFLR